MQVSRLMLEDRVGQDLIWQTHHWTRLHNPPSHKIPEPDVTQPFLGTPQWSADGLHGSDSGRPREPEGGGRVDVPAPQPSPRTLPPGRGRVTEQGPLAAPFPQNRPKWRYEGTWMPSLRSRGTNNLLEKQEGHSGATKNTEADFPAQK